jgi:uncharacterized RDD family membrane protein YckC
MAALLLDMVIQLALGAVILAVVLPNAGHVDAAGLAALSLSCWILIIVGYPVIFETLTRGKTLGKLALGQRIVSDDGSPERFRQALIRALAGVLEVWLVIGAPAGLLCCILSAKGKRLGDLLAGTFAIQERVPRRAELPPAFAVVPPPLLQWAQALELSRLSDQTAAAAGSFLRRFADLRPAARDELGRRLATAVAEQVSPPPPAGTPAADYLAAVLAVRRQREHARLAAPGPVPPATLAGVVPGPVTGTSAGSPAGGQHHADQPRADQPHADQPGGDRYSADQYGAGAGEPRNIEPGAGGFVPPA